MAYDSWNRKINDKKRFKHISWRRDDGDYGYINDGYVKATKYVTYAVRTVTRNEETWHEGKLEKYILHNRERLYKVDRPDPNRWYGAMDVKDIAKEELRKLPDYIRKTYVEYEPYEQVIRSSKWVDIPKKNQFIQSYGSTSYWKYLKKQSNRRLRAQNCRYLNNYERTEREYVANNNGYQGVFDIAWIYD